MPSLTRPSILIPSGCSDRFRVCMASSRAWPPFRARCPIRCSYQPVAGLPSAARLPTRVVTWRHRHCARWHPGMPQLAGAHRWTRRRDRGGRAHGHFHRLAGAAAYLPAGLRSALSRPHPDGRLRSAPAAVSLFSGDSVSHSGDPALTDHGGHVAGDARRALRGPPSCPLAQPCGDMARSLDHH